jgi:gas vesicle protein
MSRAIEINGMEGIREEPIMNRNEGYAGGAGFALGVVAGVVVGAGIALLFAPKPGRDLRHDLGESMGSLGRKVADKYRDLSQRAGAEMENVEAGLNRAADSVESSARDFGRRV